MIRAGLRGVFLGLLVLALELVLVLRAQAIGIAVDIKGPLKALLESSGKSLFGLSLRIGVSYVLAFVMLSALAWLVAWCVRGTKRLEWALIAAGLVLVVWRRAVRTPALFLDLPGAWRWLGPLVDRGEPWHPLAAAAVLLLVLLALAIKNRSFLRYLTTAVISLIALSIWEPQLLHRQAKPRKFETVCPKGGACAAPPTTDAAPPLVILFGIDALRPDRLRAFGATRSVVPAVDAFVSAATLFTEAYTPIAATDAAWRSLLTAQLPSVHGVRYSLTDPSAQNLGLDTFARVFTRSGYTTVFGTDCSRFHWEADTSGFTYRHQPPRGAVNFLLEKLRFRILPIFDFGLAPELTENRALAGMHDARADAERIAAFVVSRAKQGPLLYAFHATAAHFPGDPEYPFYRYFVPASVPLERRLRMHFAPISKTGTHGNGPAVNEALYDELLAQADMQLGVLTAALAEEGLYERATIVVFSDHGEDFYNDRPALKGELSVHGALLNDAENHIVLALKSPGVSPVQVKELVRLTDVGPTLLDLVKLPALAETNGRSLVPLLHGQKDTRLLQAETGFTHADPDVFLDAHYKGALRSFEAYALHHDGSVSVKPEVHAEILREKDFGVFDGTHWLVRWRDQAGVQHDRCSDRHEREVDPTLCPSEWRARLDVQSR